MPRLLQPSKGGKSRRAGYEGVPEERPKGQSGAAFHEADAAAAAAAAAGVIVAAVAADVVADDDLSRQQPAADDDELAAALCFGLDHSKDRKSADAF